MKQSIIKFACFGFALSICACRGASDSAQQGKNIVNAAGNPVLQTANYASSCQSSTIPNMGALKFPGVQTVYGLSSLDFSKKQIYYTDGDCKSQALVVEETGSVDVRGPSTKVNNALDEDFNFTKTTVTPLSQSVADGFNLVGVCGAKDWTLGVAKDVSSQATQMTCPGEPSPRVAYEISALSNGNLVLGANATETEEIKRPTQLDQKTIFIKQ